MTRRNFLARRLVLLVALLSTFGLGFGQFSEDLCPAGGSYAYDPGCPAGVNDFALPLRPQSAHRTAVPASIGGLSSPIAIVVAVNGSAVVSTQPAAPTSIDTPQRC